MNPSQIDCITLATSSVFIWLVCLNPYHSTLDKNIYTFKYVKVTLKMIAQYSVIRYALYNFEVSGSCEHLSCYTFHVYSLHQLYTFDPNVKVRLVGV